MYIIQNGMGSEQVKIACSHGWSNTLRFATFGDVSNVLSSFLLTMSNGLDKMDSPRDIFELRTRHIGKVFGFISFSMQWAVIKKKLQCPRQVKQIKI